MSKAHDDIAAERERQKSVEGWTEAHDDHHSSGEMAAAAGCYALYSAPYWSKDVMDHSGIVARFWPWSRRWWKPKNARQNLVRAGALIEAEIERLDRAEDAAHEGRGSDGNAQ